MARIKQTSRPAAPRASRPTGTTSSMITFPVLSNTDGIVSELYQKTLFPKIFCEICTLLFNSEGRVPLIVCPEGHTMCLQCFSADPSPTCPFCREPRLPVPVKNRNLLDITAVFVSDPESFLIQKLPGWRELQDDVSSFISFFDSFLTELEGLGFDTGELNLEEAVVLCHVPSEDADGKPLSQFELNKVFLTQSLDLIEKFLHDLHQTELMNNFHKFLSYMHKEDHGNEYVFDYFKEEVEYYVGSFSDLRRSIERFKIFSIGSDLVSKEVVDDQVGDSSDDQFDFIVSELVSSEVDMEGVSSSDYDYDVCFIPVETSDDEVEDMNESCGQHSAQEPEPRDGFGKVTTLLEDFRYLIEQIRSLIKMLLFTNPETLCLSEIREEMRGADMFAPQNEFANLVGEILNQNGDDLNITLDGVEALQEAAEIHLTEVFHHANNLEVGSGSDCLTVLRFQEALRLSRLHHNH
ncbi:hypothetical protein GEMRC1_000409 [Eukaryota sp. GEM-RC1]